MSISIVQRIVKTGLNHVEKFVAIAFALHLNEKNQERGAWVGVSTLACETSLPVRTIERAMSGLRKKNILRRKGYKTGRAAKMPIYTVHPENLEEPAAETESSRDESATAEENAPLSDGGPARQIERTRQNLADEQENRAFNKRERTNQVALSSDSKTTGMSAKQTDQNDFFVWLAEKYNLNLTIKQRQGVAAVVPQYPMDILTLAVDRTLDGLDTNNTFDHCGNKLAANLETQCRVIQRDRANSAAEEVIRKRQLKEMRAEADARIAERRAAAAQEEDLIEETLGEG